MLLLLLGFPRCAQLHVPCRKVDGGTVADGGRFVWFNSGLQKACSQGELN